MGSRDTENTKFEETSEMFKWKTIFIVKFLDMLGDLYIGREVGVN